MIGSTPTQLILFLGQHVKLNNINKVNKDIFASLATYPVGWKTRENMCETSRNRSQATNRLGKLDNNPSIVVFKSPKVEFYSLKEIFIQQQYKIIERVFSFNVSYSTLKNARVEDE